MLYIGIDLGTSAVKLLLVNERGDILGEVSKEYPVYYPQSGWSEQNPADWWTAVKSGIAELTANCDKSEIAGIGAGGQMHGLVVLDENDDVIRPAILWCDTRTGKECQQITQLVGAERLIEITANPALAGFTASKIMWVKNNEPENYKKCR